METVTARLSRHGLTVRLNDHGGLEVDGLKSSPVADQLRKYIKENREQIIWEIQRMQQVGPAAYEIIDLVKAKLIRLNTDGKGGVWWSAPEYEKDPGSLSWIAQIWEEAFEDIFFLLDSGKMELLWNSRP